MEGSWGYLVWPGEWYAKHALFVDIFPSEVLTDGREPIRSRDRDGPPITTVVTWCVGGRRYGNVSRVGDAKLCW